MYKGEEHYHQSQRTEMAMGRTCDSMNGQQPFDKGARGLDAEIRSR